MNSKMVISIKEVPLSLGIGVKKPIAKPILKNQRNLAMGWVSDKQE